ncbi:MAG: tetratricopeptide repeat protein [Isosphaeraceae bacterium]
MNQVSRNIGREPRPHTVHEQWLDHAIPVGHRLSSKRGSGWAKAVRLLSAALLACGLSGCQSFSVPFAQWTAGYDPSLTKKISKAEKDGTTSETVEEPRTLLQRWLNPKKDKEAKDDDSSKLPSSKSPSTLVLGSDGWRPMLKPQKNPEAEKEFDEAHKLFQQGKLAEAETAFAKIAKNRKGSHWGERAQYYVAEIQYQQKRYVKANDSYERLFADYPGTEFLDKLVSREYALAQMWLSQSDPKAKPEQKLPWYTHFTGEQPIIDTQGMALKALEHVRHHWSDGPLADDAVLQIAEFHMRTADYESAATYYDQLIADHQKSPFFQKAQLAAIDARMKAYLGPEYDGSGLEKARELVKQTMTSFPDRQASYENLYHTLDLINDQEAERTYKVGEYYKRVGKVASAEYYFGKIPQRWPSSPWALKSKTELAQLAKMPRKPSVPSKIMTRPGSNDPFYSGMGGMGMGGMGGMGGIGGMPGGMM